MVLCIKVLISIFMNQIVKSCFLLFFFHKVISSTMYINVYFPMNLHQYYLCKYDYAIWLLNKVLKIISMKKKLRD